MAAAGIKIMCGFEKKEKRVFPLFWFFYMRESSTLFFHEDETHLFLYIMRRWGRVVLNFISKKGERKKQDRFNHSGEFLFSFSWKYHHLYVCKRIEKRFFLPMDRALLLRIGYISKWSGKFVCCCYCCCSLRFELFRSRSWALGFRLMLFRHYSAQTNSSLSRELFSRVSAKKDRAYSTALNLVFLFTHMNAQQMKQEKNLVGWKIIGRDKETWSPHRSHSYELITRHPKFVWRRTNLFLNKLALQ
jgi:hypothetical protein